MEKTYKYTIDGRVLFIEGEGPGGRSLTNSIKEVIGDIGKEMGRPIGDFDFDIIYRDSEGTIDGVYLHGGVPGFYYIGEEDFYAAKLKIRRIRSAPVESYRHRTA